MHAYARDATHNLSWGVRHSGQESISGCDINSTWFVSRKSGALQGCWHDWSALSHIKPWTHHVADSGSWMVVPGRLVSI